MNLEQQLQVSYGWRVVFASWLAVFCLFGFRSTFAILKDPISDELGLSQAEVTLGYSLMMVFYAITAFFSGLILDRWGNRPAYMIAAITGGVSFFLTANSASFHLFLISFGFLGGISTGMLWVTSTVSVRKWFTGNSYATMWGMAFAGAPMSQLALSYLTRGILVSGDHQAWRVAMTVLGWITLAALALASILTRNSPENYGMAPTGTVKANEPEDDYDWPVWQAFSTRPVWLMIFVFLTSMMAEFLIWTQVVSYWTTDLSWNVSVAVEVYASIGMLGIFTMPIMGVAADRIVKLSSCEAQGRKRMLILGPFLGLVASCLLLLSGSSIVFAYSAAVVFALYWAIVAGGVVGYTGAIYGAKTLGRIWGLATLIVMGTGPFLGSYLGALMKDLSGTYTMSLYFATGSFFLSMLIAMALPIKLSTPKEINEGSPFK